MDFIRSTSEKVKLWRVEHFFPPFFSRSVLIGGKFIFYKKIHYKICKCCNFNQSALIWKKTGEKSVQLVRVSLFRKYFLWNPYFSILEKAISILMGNLNSGHNYLITAACNPFPPPRKNIGSPIFCASERGWL